jgi:hypothetical protein
MAARAATAVLVVAQVAMLVEIVGGGEESRAEVVTVEGHQGVEAAELVAVITVVVAEVALVVAVTELVVTVVVGAEEGAKAEEETAVAEKAVAVAMAEALSVEVEMVEEERAVVETAEDGMVAAVKEGAEAEAEAKAAVEVVTVAHLAAAKEVEGKEVTAVEACTSCESIPARCRTHTLRSKRSPRKPRITACPAHGTRRPPQNTTRFLD